MQSMWENRGENHRGGKGPRSEGCEVRDGNLNFIPSLVGQSEALASSGDSLKISGALLRYASEHSTRKIISKLIEVKSGQQIDMSAEASPEPPSRSRSPKRKRSESEDFRTPPQYDGAGDAALQYAYDDDLPSDAEQGLSPDEGPVRKKIRVERPTTLSYVAHMTLRGHKRGVAAVKYSPDGKWIASCCKSSLYVI